jgi:hypothetical protein
VTLTSLIKDIINKARTKENSKALRLLALYCDGGTQDSNIKTVLFILRTIDTEEGRQ